MALRRHREDGHIRNAVSYTHLIGVELYTGYIFLSDFGLALGLIFLYLMMNNPGDYIDSKMCIRDREGFRMRPYIAFWKCTAIVLFI